MRLLISSLVVVLAFTSTARAQTAGSSDASSVDATPDQGPSRSGSQLKNVFRLLGEEAEVKSAVATKIAQRQVDAPAVIEVITQSQLQAAGYNSVAEALDRIPGLAVNSDLVYSNVGVRGISGGLRSGARNLKILIDGQPVAFRPDAQNFLGPELIPITVIDRIEILRGPASALYGLNAFLGVVNVVTKQAAAANSDGSTNKGEYALTGRYFNINKNSGGGGEALLVDRYGGLAVTMAAQYTYQNRSGLSIAGGPDASDYAAGDKSKNDTAKPKSAFASFGYDTGSAGKFTLTGNYQQLDSAGEFVDYGALSHGTRIDLNNYFVRLRHEIELPVLKLTSYAAFSGGGPLSGDTIQPMSDGQPLSYHVTRNFGNHAVDAGTEASIPFLSQSVAVAGIEFSDDLEKIRTNNYISNSTGSELAGASPNTVAFRNIAGYAQGLWRELSWLQLAANVRFDDNNQFGRNFNYRGAAVIAPTDDFRIKLLSGSSYRGPTPEQLYGTPIAPGDVQGSLSSTSIDPHKLNPQTATNQEISLNHELHMNEEHLLRTSLNGYYTAIRNRIEFLPEAGQLQPANTATSKTWGGEFLVSYTGNNIGDFLSVSVSGSASYANTTIDLDQAHLTQRDIDRLSINEIYPKWMYKAFATLQAPSIHLRLYGQIIAYGERLQSQINQTNRPFEGQPPLSIPTSYPVDLTLSTMGLSLIKGTVQDSNYETIVLFKVQDVFNTQSPEPGFNGINLPPLGRRYYVMLRQNF